MRILFVVLLSVAAAFAVGTGTTASAPVGTTAAAPPAGTTAASPAAGTTAAAPAVGTTAASPAAGTAAGTTASTPAAGTTAAPSPAATTAATPAVGTTAAPSPAPATTASSPAVATTAAPSPSPATTAAPAPSSTTGVQYLPSGQTLVTTTAYSNVTVCLAGGTPLAAAATFTPTGGCQPFTSFPNLPISVYQKTQLSASTLWSTLYATDNTCSAAATIGAVTLQNGVCGALTVNGVTVGVKATWVANSLSTTGVATTAAPSSAASVVAGLLLPLLSLIAVSFFL